MKEYRTLIKLLREKQRKMMMLKENGKECGLDQRFWSVNQLKQQNQ